MMRSAALCAACLVSLTACAEMGTSYQPILDGQPDQTYQSDLQSCQNLARHQSFREDEIGATIIGGVFGGLIGDHESGITGAEGAAAGALFGFIGALFDGVTERKSIVIACMKGRGHRVVG